MESVEDFRLHCDFCFECNRKVRVTEPRAFGVDKSRCTLACGHIVLRKEAIAWQNPTTQMSL